MAGRWGLNGQAPAHQSVAACPPHSVRVRHAVTDSIVNHTHQTDRLDRSTPLGGTAAGSGAWGDLNSASLQSVLSMRQLSKPRPGTSDSVTYRPAAARSPPSSPEPQPSEAQQNSSVYRRPAAHERRWVKTPDRSLSPASTTVGPPANSAQQGWQQVSPPVSSPQGSDGTGPTAAGDLGSNNRKALPQAAMKDSVMSKDRSSRRRSSGSGNGSGAGSGNLGGQGPAVASKRSLSTAPPQPPPEDTLWCTHFGQCSGCVMSEHLASPSQWQDARQYFRSLGLADVPMVAGPVHGWRRRAKLAVRGRPGDLTLGLFRVNSHEVLPIPECAAHHPNINAAAQLVKQAADSLQIEPYNEANCSGLLRYLQLTVVNPLLQQHSTPPNRATPAAPLSERYASHAPQPKDSVQVVLVVRASGPMDPQYAQAKALAEAVWTADQRRQQAARGNSRQRVTPLVHSVWLNLYPEPGNLTLGRHGWVLCHGPQHMWEAWGRVPVCLAPGSFMQANGGAFASAIEHMRAAMPKDARRLVEMHAGVGAIGLSLSAAPGSSIESVRCVEVNPEGMAPFLVSAQALGIPPEHIHTSQSDPSVHKFSSSQRACTQQSTHRTSPAGVTGPSTQAKALRVEYWAEAAGSRPSDALNGADVVVVDPPRKGLESSLLAALTRVEWDRPRDSARVPRRLVYLSCGLHALQRDAAVLLGLRPQGWQEAQGSKAADTTGSAGKSKGRTRKSSGGPRKADVQASRDTASSRSGADVIDDQFVRRFDEALRRMRTSGGAYAWEPGHESAKWRLVSATAFLFFPGTDSIETLAVFEEVM